MKKLNYLKMKSFLVIILFLCFTLQNIIAQIEKPFTKGNILTGGSFALSFGSVRDFNPGISPLPDVTYSTKSKATESTLSFGYFIVNQFAVGLKNEILLSRKITTSSLTPETEWDITIKDFLIGPVMRFYTKPGIFVEGSAGIRFLKNISNDDAIKWNKYSWSTGLGYSILINQSIAIEPIIKYRCFYTEIPELKENEKLGELNISVGFQIYINTNNMD